MENYLACPYTTMTLAELKQELKTRKLKISGNKTDLVIRLIENDKKIAEENERFKQEQRRFKVYIKTLVGTIYTIHIDQSASILELKEKIEQEHGIPVAQQRLYYLTNYGATETYTTDDDTLIGNNVMNGSFFKLHLRLRN